ncbi:hypothetical protein BH24CHL4_BH24CHL4_04710 [soil metagenome]
MWMRSVLTTTLGAMVKVVRDYTGARRDGRRPLHVAESSTSEIGQGPDPEQELGLPPAPKDPLPGSPADVFAASLLDLIRVRRLDSIYWLNQPEHSLNRAPALASPLGAAAKWSDLRPTVLIGHADSRLAGFAEFRPILPDLRWQLIAIGAANDLDDPLPVWSPILDQGTREAGKAGVKRLYARAPESTQVGEALRAAGYSAYAHELIFVSGAPAAITPGIEDRAQERADTWAVHQLYNSSVPKEVLYAEAYTSHRWELPRGRMRFGRATRAWIAERNHAPVAYVRCKSAQRRHVLDVIFEPRHLDDAAGLIDEVLERLQREGTIAQVFCAVRGYEMELERVLLERNFRPWLSQDLFVRYTTAPVRVMTAEMVFSDAEAVERARRRAPVYLAGAENND